MYWRNDSYLGSFCSINSLTESKWFYEEDCNMKSLSGNIPWWFTVGYSNRNQIRTFGELLGACSVRYRKLSRLSSRECENVWEHSHNVPIWFQFGYLFMVTRNVSQQTQNISLTFLFGYVSGKQMRMFWEQ